MVYRTALTTPVFGLRREIDRLFEDAFGRGDSNRMGWSPAVNIHEDETSLTFEFELPGFRPDQVEVTADQGVLTVRGERQDERKEGDQTRYHLVERSTGSFMRSFQLPQGLDEEKIEASFEHGLLMVRVPKAALPQPRKIEIRSGSEGTAQVRGNAAGTTANAKLGGRQANAEHGKEGVETASAKR
jgi:HSP20 family protein